MSEEEWFNKGDVQLDKWREDNKPYLLTQGEEEGFEYAWELAGREMGVVQ